MHCLLHVRAHADFACLHLGSQRLQGLVDVRLHLHTYSISINQLSSDCLYYVNSGAVKRSLGNNAVLSEDNR